jgi:hypothetical protein
MLAGVSDWKERAKMEKRVIISSCHAARPARYPPLGSSSFPSRRQTGLWGVRRLLGHPSGQAGLFPSIVERREDLGHGKASKTQAI